MATSDPAPLPPDTPSISRGRYQLARRLGEGGMAGVYLAWDTRLRVWRAIKVLFPQYARKEAVRKRFEVEAHTMARLEHPNLVRVYDVGSVGGLPYLVMELVDGGTLYDWVRQYGEMSPKLACNAILQVAAGVRATHEAGVVHRDVKPQNVLISPTNRCKLTDFGIALQDDSSLTKTGMAMGTVGYMAPEQRYDAKSVDHRADIYGLGATLWTLLAGELAPDLSLAEAKPQLLERIPHPLRDVIQQACAFEIDDRYGQTVFFEEHLLAVMRTLTDDPPESVPLNAALPPYEQESEEEESRYSEIFAVLDSARSSSTEEDDDNGVATQAPAPKKAPEAKGAKPLPYFMPQAPAESRSYFERAQDHSIPDYVDRKSVFSAPTGKLLFARPGMTPITAPRVDASGKPLPPLETIGADLNESELSGPVQRSSDSVTPPPVQPARSATPVAPAVPVEQRAILVEAPPSYAPRTPSWYAVALVPLAIVVGAGLLMGLFVLISILWIRMDLLATYDATLASRDKMYGTIESQGPQVVERMVGAGLEDAYLTYRSQEDEPERVQAALAFLDRVDDADAERLSGVGDPVEHLVRRLRASRNGYDENITMWRQSTDHLPGNLFVTVGFVPKLPEER